MSNPVPEAAADPLLLDPLDLQHDTDPADDHSAARHIPHLGHTLVFFSLTALMVFLCAAATLGLITGLQHVSAEAAGNDYPAANLVAQGAGYILALLTSAKLFPRLWEKSFLAGIEWNFLALKRNWQKLLALGITLSAAAQYAEDRFIHMPDHAPVERVFTTQHGAYITMVMAVILAPLLEEIAFRGFLLPALAIAYDWLALERTPAGLQKWQSSSLHTASALVFAALFSSVPFALIHAAQISFAWGAVGILYCVSLIFSYVRIRLHSVACSAFTHAIYNLTIFLFLFATTAGFRHLEQFSK
jgi:membrane protease YdiL (CAAX protease family)